MKYTKAFERDFRWFLKVRHSFNFDGQLHYINKKGNNLIQYSINGVSGKEVFFRYDSEGIVVKTKHPNLLRVLLKTKGSVNLYIKMYAEDLATCNWNKIEMRALCIKYKAPYWFRQAIEKTKLTLI